MSKVDPRIKISHILEKKKRENPIGLITAQKNGTMAEFLADDLKAAGINPAAVVFGSSPYPNSHGVASTDTSVPKSLTQSNQTATNPILKPRVVIETPKCSLCTKFVYKAEEVLVLGCSWHKGCFKCGGTSDQGCKRVLFQDSYEHQSGQPYCKSCSSRLFKQAATKISTCDSSEVKTNLEPAERNRLTAATTYEDKTLHPLKSYQNMKVSVTQLSASYTEAVTAPHNNIDKSQIPNKPERLRSYMNMNVNIKELKSSFSSTPVGDVVKNKDVETQVQKPVIVSIFSNNMSDPTTVVSAAVTAVPIVTVATAATHIPDVTKVSTASRYSGVKTDTSGSYCPPYSSTCEKPRPSNAVADKFRFTQTMGNKCPCCTKTVYKAEELFANGSYWHQMCFTCGGREGHGCKRRLNATSFQLHTGEPYCKTCFDRLVKAAFQRSTVSTADKSLIQQ